MKTYCEGEFDKADDKKKEIEQSISDLEKAIDETEDAMKTLGEEIKALEDGIVKLDREVVEATEQRKDEHAEFEEMRAANTAVIGSTHFFKLRMLVLPLLGSFNNLPVKFYDAVFQCLDLFTKCLHRV